MSRPKRKPTLVRGDLLGPEFEAMCRQAPKDATLVVFHTAVLAYVTNAADRMRFGKRASALGDVWIWNEAPNIMPDIDHVPADALRRAKWASRGEGGTQNWRG
ncbi:hypothetical protein [Tianweitania sediminis]|uniref:Uncharacterized protein n=1 Tax=Tianweitania sediminis TaxID=1502156 RepID=A0A8J7UM46_9HYPH|nr:hypothetical protein [Tianweitania sediminis]MBP0439972.1 hypothetical protein [Tianweitania sediminis]